MVLRLKLLKKLLDLSIESHSARPTFNKNIITKLLSFWMFNRAYHHSKCCTWINAFNLNSIFPTRFIVILHFWGTEKVINMLMVLQTVMGGGGIQGQAVKLIGLYFSIVFAANVLPRIFWMLFLLVVVCKLRLAWGSFSLTLNCHFKLGVLDPQWSQMNQCHELLQRILSSSVWLTLVIDMQVFLRPI